jgi:hypothetical protein
MLRRPPPLSLVGILKWADDHHRFTGSWPRTSSGPVRANLNESWRRIDRALRHGDRGLPGGDSLPRLLARERGARNHMALPSLSEEEILAWVKEHKARTGAWPNLHSGPISSAPGERWGAVETALREGGRGLPGGSSLGKLLARCLGARTKAGVPKLTVRLILRWADEHHARTGHWPHLGAGAVQAALGEHWKAIDTALRLGCRGLAGGSSLAMLLAQRRGARNRAKSPRLSPGKIRRWAEAYRARTGHWPTGEAGPVVEAPGETWKGVEMALFRGRTGLPGGRWPGRRSAIAPGGMSRELRRPLAEDELPGNAPWEYLHLRELPAIRLIGRGTRPYNAMAHGKVHIMQRRDRDPWRSS